jgi:hypothetical protein
VHRTVDVIPLVWSRHESGRFAFRCVKMGFQAVEGALRAAELPRVGGLPPSHRLSPINRLSFDWNCPLTLVAPAKTAANEDGHQRCRWPRHGSANHGRIADALPAQVVSQHSIMSVVGSVPARSTQRRQWQHPRRRQPLGSAACGARRCAAPFLLGALIFRYCRGQLAGRLTNRPASGSTRRVPVK